MKGKLKDKVGAIFSLLEKEKHISAGTVHNKLGIDYHFCMDILKTIQYVQRRKKKLKSKTVKGSIKWVVE